jgi:hypothetical protein
MPDELRNRVAAGIIRSQQPERPNIDEVETEAKHMEVIDKTLTTARKLSGTDALQEELRRKDASIKEAEEAKDKVSQALEQARADVVRAELGGKIDSLSEAIKQGASRTSVADEIAEVRKAAENLGLGTSKISELKEVLALVNTMRPSDKNLAQQIKEAKEMLGAIEGDREPRQSGMSAEAVLKLEEMKNNLAIQLEQMRDDRERRRQEFEVRLKQFEIDNQFRKAEVEGKIAVERERNQMIGDLLESLGGTFTKATVENANNPIGARQINRIIEAGEGQFGETQCPACKSIIPIAADAVKAICPGCQTVYPIKRIPSSVEDEVE